MYKEIKNMTRDVIGSLYYKMVKRYQYQGNRCLIYHAFGSKLLHDTYGISINKNRFEDHIKYLTDNYRIVETTKIKNDLCISISIDDGYACTTEAVEILSKYQVPFSLFITSSNIGKKQYLSEYDLIQISSIEYAQIGSHGESHKKLGMLSYSDQYNELKNSKEIIENIISKSVLAISYPHGSYNHHTTKIARLCNYQYGFCSNKNYNIRQSNRYLLNRSEVIATDSSENLTKKILGHYDYY
tara:strand:- start:1774 stop:2499 length:726 start_codon:yes stop_codon:yes gene_type:complete